MSALPPSGVSLSGDGYCVYAVWSCPPPPQVLQYELRQVREACTKLEDGYQPGITFMHGGAEETRCGGTCVGMYPFHMAKVQG